MFGLEKGGEGGDYFFDNCADMTDLILIGKQGSGKGTQGKILGEKYGFEIFETGGELRKLAASDTELGREVKAVTERGDLVSNELVMQIVANFLQGVGDETRVIFDGIPRSEVQRESLEAELAKVGRTFTAVEITLSDEEAMRRLLQRRKCNNCGKGFLLKNEGDVCPYCPSYDFYQRPDDKPESIQKRLDNFAQHTAPIVEIWRERGCTVTVDGEQDIDIITAELVTALGL